VRHWTIIGLIVLALGLLGSAGAASAQQPVPPEHYTLDPHGVDLVSGQFVMPVTEVAIGPAAGGLSHGRIYLQGGSPRDSRLGTISISGSTYVVSVGGETEVFVKSGSVFTPQSQQGSTLTQVGTGYTFTSASGAVAHFFSYASNVQTPYGNGAILLSDYKTPDGGMLTYNYKGVTYCRIPILDPDPEIDPEGPHGCQQFGSAARLQSITNNRGYMLHFDYEDENPDQVFSWLRYQSVTGINLAVDYCDPFDDDCTGLSRTWPSVAYGVDGSGNNISTDQAGRTTTFVSGTYGLSSIRFPGASVDDISTTVNSAGQTTALTDATGAWAYSYADVGTVRTTVATGPLGQSTTVVSDLTIGRATSVTQTTSASPPVSRTWTYHYDAQRRLDQITNPEGDYTTLAYDGRGNVTTTTAVAKSGSGLANIVTSAAYPASCSNPVICNKPTATTDARGNVTDYVWNATHGGLESVTAPAPTPGAVRPQTRIAYAAQTAYYKNSSGVIAGAPSSVTLPVVTSACVSGTVSTCPNTADEVQTTVFYGLTGVANNLLPTQVTKGDGVPSGGGVKAVTVLNYTPEGDLQEVNGPLAGSGDVTQYRYDSARQLIGVVGPDPDGAGSLLNRAQRITYNARGQVALVEAGTTPGYSDANWSSFATLQRQATEYDVYGRPVVSRSQDAAGATLALQQVGYDAAGRPECAATRMNPGAYSGLPGATGACSQTALGAWGPDRIVQTAYDAASRPVSLTSGVGTASTITESVTYTANGKVQNIVDGAGNPSTYVYDGFDRLGQLHYPNATGGGVSSTDFDWYGYDAAGNVTFYQDRSGNAFTSGYDALNRRAYFSGPGIDDRDLGYDNLNRLTNVTTTGYYFWSLGWTYDALGRNLTQVNSSTGTVTSTYDAAGRRTRLTWPDAFYVDYDWDNGDDLVAIRENGTTAWNLAAYGYDNLGRRVWMNRGNGANTGYAYDGIGRLTTLAQDPTGTAQDVALGLAYNPAGQIVSRSVSNNSYVYTPAGSAVAYTNNLLNRLTAINGTTVGYNGLGDITSTPGAAYSYDSLGELTGSSTSLGSANYAYDPAGRLYVSTGSATRRYVYDGQQVIAEYNGSGVLQNRYVPGLGLNDVVASYDGGGALTWLLSDERQSVVGLTNGSGAATTINTYDEYGVPSASNAGRFQYTGQMWLPDAQLYHYRARAYAPQIGRFMQPDPMGYGAGANIYAYVGGDPMNLVDPMGLCGNPLIPNDVACPVGEVVVTGNRISCPPGRSCIIGADQIQQFLDSYAEVGDVVVTGQRRGGRGRGSGAPSALNPRPGPLTKECSQVLREPGRVQVFIATGTLAVTDGNTASVGWFRNVATGSTAHFVSDGPAFGFEFGAGVQGGYYNSASSAFGYSETLSVATPVFSWSATFNADGKIIGSTYGSGARAGFSYSNTNTSFTSCHVG
jgi:RHS repeat-associated protein